MGRSKRGKSLLRIMLVIIFAALLTAGLLRGELDFIKNLGSYVCFGCIGLG